jgi:hypothetical protein
MITWFTQSISSTDGVTDSESLSNEMIECDITGFDVSSVFSRCEFDSRFTFDCYYSFLLDQRKVVSIVSWFIWLPVDESSRLNLAKVAITAETFLGNCFNVGLFFHLNFGLWCSKNPFDGATSGHVCYVV